VIDVRWMKSCDQERRIREAGKKANRMKMKKRKMERR
jgi:hypothetical protein